MADTTYTYGVKPGEGANRESLRGGRMVAQKRKLPTDVSKVRAGNYAADVDMSGMDTSMVETLTEKPKGLDIVGKIKKMLPKKKVKSPAVPTPPSMSRAVEDSLSKRYLGR